MLYAVAMIAATIPLIFQTPPSLPPLPAIFRFADCLPPLRPLFRFSMPRRYYAVKWHVVVIRHNAPFRCSLLDAATTALREDARRMPARRRAAPPSARYASRRVLAESPRNAFVYACLLMRHECTCFHRHDIHITTSVYLFYLRGHTLFAVFRHAYATLRLFFSRRFLRRSRQRRFR